MYQIGPFSYSYQKNKLNSKKIYTNTEINLQAGELIVIAGVSGAGKSTLLQLLKGIIPEFSSGVLDGKITFLGKPLSGKYFKDNLQKILFLFQNPFSQLLYPNVEEEFFFSMENFQFSKEQMDQKKEELNQVFDLNSLWGKKTSELSNGECQRLVLASLLAVEPEVLLMDEPTAFLDPKAREKFYNWLKKIKGSKTIIIVDHHLPEVEKIADRFLLVGSDGEISLSDSPFAAKTFPKANLLMSEHKKPLEEMSLDVQALRFYYKNKHHPETHLLKNINLKISGGEVVAIVGENGKGKSTLFKLIAGIIKSQSGNIYFSKGKKIKSKKEFQREIGFIFQNPESHFFYDSIFEELAGAKDQSQISNLAGRFLKDIDFSRSPFQLSEGEKRRLSILMTVFLKKSVLFYDEPTFGQDKDSISQISELILSFKAMGLIQLIISHDTRFINSVADRVYRLDHGELELMRNKNE